MDTLNDLKKLVSERKSLLYAGKIPNDVRNIEEFLSIWFEFEDITTEKNKEKAYFILRDKIDGFKLYFWKSGFVKKVEKDGTRSLFLNNWSFSIEDIDQDIIHPYSLNQLIYHAHQFMISKKIICNVETYFRNKNFRENMLNRGAFSYIDDNGNEQWVL